MSFNARVSTMSQTAKSVRTDASGSSSFSFMHTSSSSSYSNQLSSDGTDSEKRTFSIGVSVQAVQDELPAGMAKVLSILEDSTRIALTE